MANFIRDYDKKKKTERFIIENLERLSNCVDNPRSYESIRKKEEERMRYLEEKAKGKGVEMGVRCTKLEGDVPKSVSQSDVKVSGELVSENYQFSKDGKLIGKGKLIK